MVVRLCLSPDMRHTTFEQPGSNAAQLSRPVFRHQSISLSGSQATDSASLSVSDPETISLRREQNALSQLSNASSFVTIAQGAADEIDRLVDKASNIAYRLQSELDPDGELAQEAEDYLTEIDNVIADAEFNDQSVINAGEKEFAAALDHSDITNKSDISITVPNIGLSRDDLGIASLTASDFTSDPESTHSTLKKASMITRSAGTLLAESENQINIAARQYGERHGIQAASITKNGISVEDLAVQVAQSIIDSDLELNPSLSSDQVQQLLVTNLPRNSDKEQNSDE